MTGQRTDRTGATVHIALDETRAISAYTVSLDDGTIAGRADFVDPTEAGGGRFRRPGPADLTIVKQAVKAGHERGDRSRAAGS